MSDEALPLPVEVPGGDASLAILLRIADAVEKVAQSTEDAGKKGEEAGARQKSAWQSITSAIESTTDRAKVLAERYVYITQAIDDMAERAEAIGMLAEEQERLDLVSSRLGVSMDEAAGAAGRFADEVEPMNASGRLLQEGVHASQTELNALMRVAGAASLMLGVTTAQATEQLTDALVSGRERGLTQFGTELGAVAGSSHTLQERLAALVSQANHTEAATDTSADAVRRLRDQMDDYKRTVATAFMQETIRIAAFGTSTRSTAGDVEDLSRKLTALGETGATMLNAIARPLAIFGGGIAYAVNAVGTAGDMVWSRLTGSRQDAQNAANAGEARSNDITSFMQHQIDVLSGMMHDGEGSTSTQGGTRADPARVLHSGMSGPGATDSEEAVLRARRADEIARNRRESPPSAPPTTREGRGRSSADEDARRAAEAGDRTIEESMRDAHRAADALRGQNPGAPRGGFMQRVLGSDETDATRDEQKRRDREAGDDAAFATSDEGRVIAQQRERNAQRERRQQDQRLEALRGFTDQFEDMHQRQANASHMMAEGVTSAFNAVGEAMGKHFELWRQGKETLGEALQGMLSSTLQAIGKEASVKGSMQIAEGLANLIIAPPLAAGNFAAAAAYFGVAGIAGAAGDALAPSSATSGAGDRGGRTAALPSSTGDARGGGNVYTWNNYAPTFGGRNGSRAEAGEQIGRYTTADEERTRRAA